MLNYRLFVFWMLALLLSGCAREHYRIRADRDAYTILHEKTNCAPWQPLDFRIAVPPASRLYDGSPPDDPCLPQPAPQLYGYQLPSVPTRDATRFTISGDPAAEPIEAAQQDLARLGRYHLRRFPPPPAGQGQVRPASHVTATGTESVQLALLQSDDDTPPQLPANVMEDVYDELGAPGVVPIEPSAWASIPASCLPRTLEFSSVVAEYERTFGEPPDPALFDAAEKLALEDLLALALLNSRQYQTQKEQLYRAALRVSLERYAFQLKFSPTGNGIDADWVHRNDFGITENSLALPSGVTLEKVLATGGTFLSRFANDVILTFNGPTGFAADVSSELFTEFTQALLQRDIVFENLTQAERNVVYAAREYARFRKQFFRDIAADYYQLLLTYRGIEINMLDFFSNRRGYQQAKYEYELRESVPLFQVDQFEQDALNSRSRVISSCNGLEQSLDLLKLRIGIPPETPINLDLTELDAITARDEITVAAEMASRAFRNLSAESGNAEERRVQVVNAAIRLAQRLVTLLELESKRGLASEDKLEIKSAVVELLNKLQVEDAALTTLSERRTLDLEVQAARPPSATNLFYLRMNVIRALIELGRRQQIAYTDNPFDGETLEQLRRRWLELNRRLDDISKQLAESEEQAEKNRLLDGISALADEAGALLEDAETNIRVDERLDASDLVERVILVGEQLRAENIGGLSPIDLPTDAAMLTALVTRFDLMNERGRLADVWRQVKLAGDDLRSVLNLRASHAIRTNSSVNRPFDFTFDESTTSASLAFDAPLNRRSQRNSYRFALIDYQFALRNLMELEDQIKFAIRSDLRKLQLDREQYAIAVTSAALANDRVISTRKQFQLNLGNITARDFLESQRAYTLSLNSVASQHIEYILDRINLFLDLELLTVDEQGFWPELYDEDHLPEMRVQPPPHAGPAFGRLPCGVHYSKSIQRMEGVPFGTPVIFEPVTDTPPAELAPSEELPPPPGVPES